MDQSLYKTRSTSRGVSYSYYFAPAAAGKRTLLLLHGFPSTSHDWARIVPVLSAAGLGVLAPDMLGYGGTDKPDDPAAYVASLITADLVDLLDHEGLNTVVAVGHDWGAWTVGRLANLHASRFDAFAFLAQGYSPPNPKFDPTKFPSYMKSVFGYNPFGYWAFHSSDDAAEAIEKSWHACFSLYFPADPSLWKEHFCPEGQMEKWLVRNEPGPLPAYLTETDRADMSKRLLAGPGIKPALNWYKAMMFRLRAEDEASIPEAAYFLKKPVFFGAADQDVVCRPDSGQKNLETFCATAPQTVKKYAGGHWIILSHADDIARDLLVWVDGL